VTCQNIIWTMDGGGNRDARRIEFVRNIAWVTVFIRFEFSQEQIVMATARVSFSAIVLVVVSAGWCVNPRMNDGNLSSSIGVPRLVNACVITNDVRRLVEFYESMLRLKTKRSAQTTPSFPPVDEYWRFSRQRPRKCIPGSAEAAKNKSVILEFRVADVDQEYRKLQSLVRVWVKPPSTQPWGTRSIYFRDPDGNLVDFYAPIKAQ
jgi:catechol 2,3-dioxygenase-like lactoylglutathione lyase family enzyme